MLHLPITLAPTCPAGSLFPRLDSLSGEVFLNNRKAKLVASYELKMTIGWKGTASNGETATGMIELPVSWGCVKSDVADGTE